MTGFTAGRGQNIVASNLLTNQPIGKLTEPLEKPGREVAVTPDGKFLAAQTNQDANGPTLRLWSLSSGKFERDIVCDERLINLTAFEFADSARVVTHTFGAANKKFVHRLRVWDVATGNRLQDIALSETFQRSHWAITPGGRFVAIFGQQNIIRFIDLHEGRQVGTVPVETAGAFFGMSFSPDGRQLAVVLGSTNTVVAFVSTDTGEIVDRLVLAGRPEVTGAYHGRAVEWLGDKGWCLFGACIVDRQARRAVWNLELPILRRLTARRTLPGGWIAAVGSHAEARITFIPIPWDQLTASLSAMQGDGKAHLKPGMSLSLNIQIGDLRFGAAEDTAKRLTEIYQKRFKADGIDIAGDQPLVLNVHYRETEGETLTEQKGGLLGESTGRTVQATRAHVEMNMTQRDSNQPLWSHEFVHNPRIVSIVGKRELTDAAARDAIFTQLLYELAGHPIPYFVPADPTMSQLPGRTRIPE